MLSNEDIKQIAQIMREELKPVNERLDKIETRLDKVEEDIGELKYDMNDAIGKINMISEWCEAASKFHIREIHYPLDPEEKLG